MPRMGKVFPARDRSGVTGKDKYIFALIAPIAAFIDADLRFPPLKATLFGAP
jgi:hypothetical protein